MTHLRRVQRLHGAHRLVADAEEHEQPGHLLEIMREILAAHDRLDLDHVARAGRLDQRRASCARPARDRSTRRAIGPRSHLGRGAVGQRRLLDDAAKLLRPLPRTSRSCVRTVPSIVTWPGMMFQAVPPWIMPTETTTGCRASLCRLGMVCNAVMMWAAATIGSTPSRASPRATACR